MFILRIIYLFKVAAIEPSEIRSYHLSAGFSIGGINFIGTSVWRVYPHPKRRDIACHPPPPPRREGGGGLAAEAACRTEAGSDGPGRVRFPDRSSTGQRSELSGPSVEPVHFPTAPVTRGGPQAAL